MLDPDSYYQNGHELMKEKLIASSLVLQDKGFIAMSKDSVTPSPMTQNNCSVSTRTLIRNSFTTGSDQRGQFEEPPGVELREPRENREQEPDVLASSVPGLLIFNNKTKGRA